MSEDLSPPEVQVPPPDDDALEWERQASETAARLQTIVSTLESELDALQGSVSFRRFWRGAREFNETLRTATPITQDDKLALQRQINTLCQRARQEQRQVQELAAS